MSNFECEICNYKTYRKWDFNKHKETKKHIREMVQREMTPEQKNAQNQRAKDTFSLLNLFWILNPDEFSIDFLS